MTKQQHSLREVDRAVDSGNVAARSYLLPQVIKKSGEHLMATGEQPIHRAPSSVHQLIDSYARLDDVKMILGIGSIPRQDNDSHSDIDLVIVCGDDGIPAESTRKQAIRLASTESRYINMGQQTWHFGFCDEFIWRGRSEEMDATAFEKTIRNCLRQGKKIATIILLGGSTLDHNIDPVRVIWAIRQKLVKEFRLDYAPHLHLDSVVAWISLVFKGYDYSNNPLSISEDALAKIRELYARISEVEYVDSFSADFHKPGLCAYTSSYFLTRKAEYIHSINSPTIQPKPEYSFGEWHPHNISFENSRLPNGIVSSWVALQRLGVNGYRQYWAHLMMTGLRIRQIIQSKYGFAFRTLNDYARGFVTVLQVMPPGFSYSFDELVMNTKARELYVDYCFGFYNFMAYELLKRNEAYPLLGFIPRYRYESIPVERPAFLVYPNSPHFDQASCELIVEGMLSMKSEFDRLWMRTNAKRFTSQKRPTHLPK